MRSKQAQLTNDETALKELETLIDNKTEDIEQLKKARKALFADKDTDHEENQLRSAADEAKAKQIIAQRQLDSIQQSLEQLKIREQQLATERQSATTTVNTQDSIFINLLAESNFVDEADFLSARLPKEEREALHIRKLAIDNALQQAKLQLNNTQHALEQNLLPLWQMKTEKHLLASIIKYRRISMS